MQTYKIHFKHHYKLQMCRCWVIVAAATEEEAIAQANKEFIKKMPGYAHLLDVKKLCEIKADRATCIEYDFVPLNNPWYNKE